MTAGGWSARVSKYYRDIQQETENTGEDDELIWSSDSLLAQVRPSQPGGHWHSKPVGTSWHVPPLAQGLDTQACSADGGREEGAFTE